MQNDSGAGDAYFHRGQFVCRTSRVVGTEYLRLLIVCVVDFSQV
ncbi:hypothetical protein GmarT_48200 [Gimesia maris]|uniref:Uncharacterized protein n=1 Tax=Gimesia maris TaxID=122 RepID=A0ABX5YTB3_9PLAN|nr:hypothetical protein GmarT_48200 [Gimesia maris]